MFLNCSSSAPGRLNHLTSLDFNCLSIWRLVDVSPRCSQLTYNSVAAMSRSPFMYSKFFSSLKQAEKRLKLENPPSTNDPDSVPSVPSPVQASLESLSSPIYLLNPDQQAKQSSTLDDSELPREFLSVSDKFSATQDDSVPQPQSPVNQRDMVDEPDDKDNTDIQLLMQLLHLTTEHPTERSGQNDNENRFCDDEFYAKVVGIEGPKCRKEAKSLEGWIRHFDNTSEEPLRLAHLILAKAASISGDDNGIRGLEFPSTIRDFLLNDPPSN